MEVPPPPSQRKRVRFSYSDDSEGDEAPKVKKPRFPKGKKEGQGDVRGKSLGMVEGEEDEGPVLLSTDPRVAALERATRRERATEQLLAEDLSVPNGALGAEEEYDEGEDEERVEDGMRIEPFNLKQEREEGYFDAEGNYVEYRNDNDTKDAWLDSVEADTRFAGKAVAQVRAETEADRDLSQGEVAGIKRRISDALQSGETVLRALRRMKGTGREGRKGERMSEAMQGLFDQLTEDAMKLLDNGDYNVYEEKKETFQREAEGYEALARLRSGGSNGAHSSAAGENQRSSSLQSDMFSDAQDTDSNQAGPSNQSSGLPGARRVNGDVVDIFGGSDGHDATLDIFSHSEGNTVENGGEAAHPSALPDGPELGAGAPAEDSGYVLDESSGYYYNSDIGYYYDARSGLYCSASTGKWYKFDEVQNSYEEVPQ